MQSILQHFFKEDSLDNIPQDKLQELAREYPYFSAGQFLLAKKMQLADDAGYKDQFQKALIYFNNPLWFQHKMSEPPIEVSALDVVVEPVTHDLMEEVVLHQELETTELRTPDPIAVEKEPSQTIQREEPFTFQAYHTVDYFASQGIKLNLDGQQHDKLGKQLKSFTEWLKTMRRLPETSVVEMLDKIKEGEITRIAATSLEENEVLTEAMAEVLVKQGQLDKAAELYHKLSLQNPHKSPYFAAKIEDLKLN